MVAAMARRRRRKKKKEEEKCLPLAMDIRVNLPDETHVLLKGISTDQIIDTRRLLAVNILTCNVDNFSLSHEVRGPRLKDTVDVSALKPCVVTLVEEDYDEDTATAHVGRLLDIVACTMSFGPSPNKGSSSKIGDPKKTGKSPRAKISPPPPPPEAFDGEGELNNTSPKLGSFYEFFSFSHLTPPLQFISKKVGGDGVHGADHLFTLEVKLGSGQLILVEASRKGFHSTGKQQILCHNLVDLLRRRSRAFDNAYDELMKAFSERNKFGNLPFGFRSNTWLIPPLAFQSPSTFPPLPAEDGKWGGNGGGLGRDGKSDFLPYANELLFIASMPCKTAEERQIRDRKAFLLHSLFVDVAIFRAIAAVQHVMWSPELASGLTGQILYAEKIGDLNIAVSKDTSNASCKIDGQQALGLDKRELGKKNLLKGITADENTTAHDIATLGIVNVRHCGYTASVKVEGIDCENVNHPLKSQVFLDQSDGGANALNINSLRLLLHENAIPEQNKVTSCEKLGSSEDFVKRLLEESLSKLQEEEIDRGTVVRWELGACWIQHLQDQRKSEKEKITSKDKSKNEMKAEGVGTPLKSLKSKKNNADECNAKMQTEVKDKAEKAINVIESQIDTNSSENELMLRTLLSDSAFTRLKESEIGLHAKSLDELIELSEKYYDEVALPKLVADFGSLELSPVDGRTLTDFMHSRGLRMHSLGQVVKLSEELFHVQSLCIHEMIIRAFKHILRAVISAVEKPEKIAAAIAAALNLMLGVPENEHLGHVNSISCIVWRWLEVFLKKRFEWNLRKSNFEDMRKFAILRGLCNKVGIELVPKDFDMKSAHPFQKEDIVALVPVHKQAACSSADGRKLLESSKTALDKGKLEEAVNYGTKALAKLVAVCGPYHRMTAGAYNLLAVVLYHTGDFNQATIYQQKALDINERELGLDHPDTMKSYGDLAVFCYRLKHTDLALEYVNRALYLLHLICGPSHPNTAATYINVAMMEEGLGNVHVALRYLHKALKCNRRLLGPDHIQTAGSYHAIAIALSLMEAYPLSVQHEQTTLQIFQAKLGPDDLRTQDSAAWLEYFESKVFEQQEAARNGTWKPDASIAIKGHLSVSDLLDYINPSHDAKGKNDVGSKRKIYIAKARVKSLQNNVAISDSDSTPKDALEADSADEKDKEAPTSCVESSLNHSSSSKASHNEENVKISPDEKPIQPEQPLPETPVLNSLPISQDLSPERHSEGEDGWQPVQRPRPAASSGKRPMYRHKHPNKVFNHQTKDFTVDVDHTAPKNNLPGYKYELKKRAMSPGSFMEYYMSKNPSSVSKFGRKVVKTVYRVKSAPLPTICSVAKGDQLSDKGLVPVRNKRSLVVSLGKSPSYKEVALAPPGTINMLRVNLPENDIYDNDEGVEHANDSANEYKSESDNQEGKNMDALLVVPISPLKDAHKVGEEIHLINDRKVLVSESSQMDPTDNSELALEGINLFVTGPNDSKEVHNKKLSPLAAPYNPSAVAQHLVPLPLNIHVPSGPGPVPLNGPWPMNVAPHPGHGTLLPGQMPPHHAYPSPPQTPNMVHTLPPFMYTPHTEPQAVPPTTFQITSTNPYHPGQFTWQCNIPITVWDGTRPIEFPSLTVVEPMSKSVQETKADPIVIESEKLNQSLDLPVDLNTEKELKNEIGLLTSEAVENLNDGEETTGSSFRGGPSLRNSPKDDYREQGHQCKSGEEKTCNILVRGRRNRKQMLRMPLSLLKRPYSSQSFKVMYSRIVRETELPSSTC